MHVLHVHGTLWVRGCIVQVGSCRLLERLAVEAPDALARCLPDVVPRVSECMVDAKDQVKVRRQGAAQS